jgi:hypothetical protein
MVYERGLTPVTVFQWVQRFTPLLIDVARPCGTLREIAGSLTKPTSSSPGGGSTCSAPSGTGRPQGCVKVT